MPDTFDADLDAAAAEIKAAHDALAGLTADSDAASAAAAAATAALTAGHNRVSSALEAIKAVLANA